MDWTNEQKQVIVSAGQNLLVSAAAGSGKTAVLVEHILQKIENPAEAVNINELLVVTFTRAAAAEMKERISAGISRRLEKEPENRHLQRQISLLPQARISTIDSFCAWLVKNYFFELDVDPDFQMMEEGEDRLLREEILDALLEDAFAGRNPAFLHLADAFSGIRGDRPLRDLILRCYDLADSEPWPEEWIRSSCDLGIREKEAWQKKLLEDLRSQAAATAAILLENRNEADEQEGLEAYADMFQADLVQAEKLLETEELSTFLEQLGQLAFVRKPTIRKPKDASVRDRLSANRDVLKARLQKMAGAYASCCRDPELEELAASDQKALAELALDFSSRYRQEKARRNLANFADVEHWALALLVHRHDGVSEVTELADEIGRTFREIIIDEYQDSNLVQETILSALSGERRGEPDMFMVGDVKQSIYKFRRARPELFMKKYRDFSYEKGHAPGQKIDLGRNFRSRGAVLDSVNRLFGRLMGEGLGGIEYDGHAALYKGSSYEEPDPPAELLICETENGAEEGKETEARLVARTIRSMTAPDSTFRLWDLEEKCFRRAHYRDFVILLRSMDGWADSLSAVLNEEGIPAYAQLKTGYFSAQEIQVLLHFLRLLDNPLQDIPLMSVLLSPIGGFTAGEAAEMLTVAAEGSLLDRLDAGAQAGICREKWQAFKVFLGKYRELSALLPIHELLELVLQETDYRLILAASPDGKVRMANLDMLRMQAMRFEETSYHGIFQFLRYMDQLKRYEVDFGEGQALSEQDDLVRITTIHKSKGLEYPVVIVAGCGKNFNLMDRNPQMLLHGDLGFACDAVDTEEDIRTPLLYRRFVADRIVEEALGEELRVLYVAMTRAREKLILTGSVRDLEKTMAKVLPAQSEKGPKLSPAALKEASSVLEWLLMASAGQDPPPFVIRVEETEGDEQREETGRGKEASRRDFLLGAAAPAPSGEEKASRWKKWMEYRYPWEASAVHKGVYSVSELKRAARKDGPARREAEQAEDDKALREQALAGEADKEKTESFWKSRFGSGAARGTAMHLAMELIPPSIGADPGRGRDFLDGLVKNGKLSPLQRKMIRPEKIAGFYRSEPGRAALRAETEGKLHREQSFVMRTPLKDVLMILEGQVPDGLPEEEWALVQGIIDAFAETGDGLILWDYKTDSVSPEDGEEVLKSRYAEQLFRYREALEKAFGKPVLKTWIYSFALEKAIML